MEGIAPRRPEVGRSFLIMNDKPLNSDNGETARMIETSTVMYTENMFGFSGFPEKIYFRTMNTDYTFEVLPDEDA